MYSASRMSAPTRRMASRKKQVSPATARLLGSLRLWLQESDMIAYLVMMTVRLNELHRSLKPSEPGDAEGSGGVAVQVITSSPPVGAGVQSAALAFDEGNRKEAGSGKGEPGSRTAGVLGGK